MVINLSGYIVLQVGWMGPEWAFLVSICVEEKYCFSAAIYISLNSETLRRTLCIFSATSNLFRAWKDGIDPLPPFYLLRVIHLIQHIYLGVSFLSDVPLKLVQGTSRLTRVHLQHQSCSSRDRSKRAHSWLQVYSVIMFISYNWSVCLGGFVKLACFNPAVKSS